MWKVVEVIFHLHSSVLIQRYDHVTIPTSHDSSQFRVVGERIGADGWIKSPFKSQVSKLFFGLVFM